MPFLETFSKKCQKIEPVLKRTVNSWLKNKVEWCEGKQTLALESRKADSARPGVTSVTTAPKFKDTRATMRPYLKTEQWERILVSISLC